MSLMDPPNQTPVRSGWAPGGWGLPLYHHAPTAGFGLRVWAPPACAAAGGVIAIKMTNCVSQPMPMEVKKVLFISDLLLRTNRAQQKYFNANREFDKQIE